MTSDNSPFTRADTVPVTLPEPYARLLAFLDDLAEQVQLAPPDMRATEGGRVILDELEQRITSMAMMVMVMGSKA